MKKVVVLGAGAIGSALAMALAEKKDVELTAVARKAHADMINSQGLLVQGKVNRVIRFQAKEKVESSLRNTLVLVTVKAYDLESSLREISAYITESTVLVLLQNGLGIRELAEKALQETLKKPLIIRGVAALGAACTRPGRISFAGGNVRVESVFASTAFRDIFLNTPVELQISHDMARDVWRKAVINSVVNPVSAILQSKNSVVARPEFNSLKKMLLEESQAVAAAWGYELSLDLARFNRFIGSENITSMYQDLLKGSKTEIDFINGAIIRRGREKGVGVRANELVFEIIRACEKLENIRAI